MSKQPSQTTATVVQAANTSACPHPEAVGKRWGDPTSEERQAELQGYLDRWAAETDHGGRKGPFDTGLDMFLAAMQPRGPTSLTEADVFWLKEGLGERGSSAIRLHLEGAVLNGAHLEGVGLAGAHLERTDLQFAHLEGVNLISAHLQGANLTGAHLEGANVARAYLDGAYLNWAHLEGTDLTEAHLEGTSLIRAWLDSKTELSDAQPGNRTKLSDIHWSGMGVVDLTQIAWGRVEKLGDERGVSLRSPTKDHEAVVRTYRQLAAQLRAQGMNEVADRFLYRAQVRERGVLLHRFRVPQYLGSWFLDLISGYGYRPWRSFLTYVLVILAFAAAYLTLGGANGQSLSLNEVIVISMTAFHGRGFFSAVFQPGDVQAAVAAVEAFIGLLIEIVFIATFTQRFFAR